MTEHTAPESNDPLRRIHFGRQHRQAVDTQGRRTGAQPTFRYDHNGRLVSVTTEENE